MLTYISHSAEETKAFAENFANQLVAGDIIAYTGSLGMGKTCFTEGLVRGLGYTGEVNSPTFAIVNEYIGGRLPVWHFDMYRVSGWDDLYSTGFFEYIESGGITAVEWSENIEAALPENIIRITIEKHSETERKITITGDRF